MKKMKYLFLLLIIINLLVLGYFLLKPKHGRESGSAVSSEQLREIHADWLTLAEPNQQSSEPIVEEVIEDNQTLIASEALLPQQASEVTQAFEPEIEKKEEPEVKLCFATVELDEKSFESIKKQLSAFPYQTKKIEKTKKEVPASPTEHILYWVHLPASGDIEAQVANLKAKGFDTSVIGNQISIGLFRKANGALSIKEKAFNAGFTQVTITEKISTQPAPAPESSIIVYQLHFKPMEEKAAQNVQAILKKHVKAKANKCP
ncbi:hypothetical protein [Neisseria sp. Ec49-e6-T10]|uniref:hypothetical protein n=1 Tax=Neisseria sp. Ec49-e6-T10 TaxID=3140744 RepID=UPI003EB7BD13